MFVVRRAAAALAAGALGLALSGSLAGCTSDEDAPTAAPTPTSTPLADYATDTVVIARGEFCARVAPRAVTEALGAEAATTASWANGDRARLAAGVRDVAHEYGCSWTAADGTVARAWVFAPPVSADRADALVRDTGRGRRCERLTDAPAYGAPSVAVSCTTKRGGRTTVQGLFGDAWLSCSLQVPGSPPDIDRTGRWCVAVAEAASA
ncbi:hypothetical protein [Nocardioides sp. URHA0020]|uniref:hypothetical protein n=1 Tax=Nocardioides sp. URHA0020 TaxID=1380392 RepID=UPI00048B4C46|nr:hypothetical protein [Nocardioides sp. URHA0020]